MSSNEQFSNSMLRRTDAHPPAPPSISSDWDMVHDVDSCDSPEPFASVAYATEDLLRMNQSSFGACLSPSVQTETTANDCASGGTLDAMGTRHAFSLPPNSPILEPDTLDSGSSTPSSCSALGPFGRIAADVTEIGQQDGHQRGHPHGSHSADALDAPSHLVSPSDNETWAQYVWSIFVYAGKALDEFYTGASGWLASLTNMSRDKAISALQFHFSRWGPLYAVSTAVVFGTAAAYYFQQSRCLRAEMDKRNADFAKVMVAYVNLRDQLESRRYPVIGWASCSAQCGPGFAAHVL